MKRHRLYCDSARRYWVDLHVFSSRDQMRRAAPRSLIGVMHCGDLAAVSPLLMQRTANGRRSGLVAMMAVNRGDFERYGIALMAHECVHAAMRYLERVGVRAVDTDCCSRSNCEERLAYTVQRLLVQVEAVMA